MRVFKKMSCILLLSFLVLALPVSAFAAEAPRKTIESTTYPIHTRIPIKLIPDKSANGANVAPMGVLQGYLDFWTEVEGKTVFANWTVTMETPGAYITRVNLNVNWGGLPPLWGGENVKFNYPTFGAPISVSNQCEKTFSSDFSGTSWTTISGSVDTTKGTGYTVGPSTIQFHVN